MGRIGHASRRRALLALLLLIPLLAGAFGVLAPPPSVRADPLSDALRAQKALEAKIGAQRQQIQALQRLQANLQGVLSNTATQLKGINVQQSRVQANVATAQQALADVRAKYAALVTQVGNLDAELSALDSKIVASQQQLADQRTTLASHIADAYVVQQTSLLEQLLTAKSLADVLADVGYYLRIGDQDARLAAQIQQTQQSLEALQQATQVTRTQTQQVRLTTYQAKTEMTSQRNALLAAQKQLDALEARTKAVQSAQLAAFNKLKLTRAQAAAQLADEQKSLDELSNQIARLVAAQQNIPSQYNGTLAWPMAGVVSQEFGCTGFIAEPPLGNCAHFHTGIDIVAPEYTPIRAAGDGTVVFVGPNPYDPPGLRAWIVIIAHSQSLLTWYAHVDDVAHPPAVYKGEVVQQGQVIAYEGNTGNSTGPHLHWAVELNGTFVNPRLFL
ncbi:MAG: murein hydrolase activator EnvC family protein [Candidatus Limnocylindrales bacterium]